MANMLLLNPFQMTYQEVNMQHTVNFIQDVNLDAATLNFCTVDSFDWDHFGQRRLDSISHGNQLNSELSFLKGRARFQYLAYCRALEEFIEGRPDFKHHHFWKRH